MLALLEDVPMVCLTFVYALRLQGVQASVEQSCVKPFWIVSMMMSAGAIYLKFGALIYFPLLVDQQKDLQDRIARKATNWLSAEERKALEHHGIWLGHSQANKNAGADLLTG